MPLSGSGQTIEAQETPNMKRLLALLVLITILVAPVLAIRSNFQDWDSEEFDYVCNAGGSLPSPLHATFTVDAYNIVSGQHSASPDFAPNQWMMCSGTPTAYTYLAFDLPYAAIPGYTGGANNLVGGQLLDSAGSIISTSTILSPAANTRYEIKVIGATPTLFVNGVQDSTEAVITVDPTYALLYANTWNGVFTNYISDARPFHNIVVGETIDHHAISALPSNWTILRDMITPTATGVYAWNPSTGAWVSKNSLFMYIDADKEVLGTAEDVVIRYQSGAIVNTTSVSNVHNLIQYNVSQFLNTATSLGTTLPDGRYQVSFSGSNVVEYFWVQSTGAVVSFDKDLYHSGDTATLTYTITPGYYDTVTYTYTYKVMDIYGDELATGSISAASGTFTVNTAGYTQGVIYAEILATKVADPNAVFVLGWDATEMVETLYLNGYVMDAETGGVLNNANVSITQGSQSNFSYSIPSGAWNSSAEWAVGAITVNTTLTGYTPDLRAFTTLSSKTVNLNISLMSVTPTASGVTIGGVVRDDVFGNPIPAATYHVGSNTATTNIAGFARIGSLVHGTVYDVYSTKTGYSDSTHHSVTAVGI
jgi:hypothetical protein